MITSKSYLQVDSSFFEKRRQHFYALFSMLIAVFMLAGVWGTTAVYAAALITPDQTFDVDENSATGTPVGMVLTTGDPVTSFSIEAGNNGNAFSIDVGGNIAVLTGTSIDYETTPVFTLTIRTDGDETTDEDVVINVNDMNDAPDVAASHAFSFAENSGIGAEVGSIVATDSPGNILNYSIVQWISSAGPFLVNPGNGIITATADLDYETDQTSYIFIVRVSDGGRSSNTTVTINVTNENDKPVAVDDIDAAYTVAEYGTLAVTVPTVLDNDSDADGDNLTAVNASTPADGSVTLNPNGTFTYTPDPGFDGVDTFTYQAQDDGVGTLLSDVATVSITITGVNDAPTADDDTYTTPEETTLTVTAPGVLDNDDDPEHDSLTAVLVDNVQNGTLTFSDDGSFVYTPTIDFVGADTFTYKANDGDLLSDLATVTITVTNENDAPTAVPDPDYEINEDITLIVNAVNGVLANDTDPEDDILTAHMDSDVSDGNLTLQIDGSFTYIPDPGFNGTDTFTYHAEDDSDPSNTTTVTITVVAQNDPPVADDDEGEPYSTTEDTQLTMPAPGVLENDTDVDGDDLTAVNASDPANGSVTLALDGSFVYMPDEDFYGTDTFTYQAQDDGTGNLLSNTATVTITVTPDNDAPLIDDQSFSIDENSPASTVVGTVSVSDIDDAVPADMTFGKLAGGLGYDSFAIDADSGEITVLDPTDLNIEARRSLTLTVIVSDTEPLTDTAVITINLNNVNEFAPEVQVNQIFTITETAVPGDSVGQVIATDEDWEEDPAVFTITVGTGSTLFEIDNNGNIVVAAGATFDHETDPTYTLNLDVEDDGSPAVVGNGSVRIDITDANDAPVIGNDLAVSPASASEGDSVTLTGSFTDDDAGDNHQVVINWGDGSANTVVDNATEIDASHTYEDDPTGLPDTYAIQVTVTDDGTGALSDSANTSVTVTNVAPLLSNVAIATSGIDEGQSATLTGNIADAGINDSFTLSVNWGDGSSASMYSYPAGTTAFTVTHTFVDDGQPLTVYLTLADNDGGEDIDSETITVNNVAPTVEAGSAQIVNVNTQVQFDGSFTDPGTGDTHTIEWDFDDSDTASGSLTPQHAYTAIGIYTATLTVTDDDGGLHSDDVVITVVSPSDIAATKTVSGQFREGGSIFYTITMTNNGDSAQLDNAGDELTDVLPAQLVLVDAQVISGGGAVSAVVATNTVAWNGSIDSGNSVVIEIEATILPGTKGEEVSNQATVAYDADGDGSNEATTFSDDPALSGDYDATVFNVADEYLIYLPVIVKNHIVAPDLVVTNINASSGLIEVVIENQGNAPVLNSFWVDFYINPNPVPTVSNELWVELGSEGLAWGVTDSLAVGETMTLTFSTTPGAPNLYFVAEESKYYGSLPAGTPVYAQVDSAHEGINFGAIQELDELGYGSYNNILGGTAVSGVPAALK